ncbi:MAG: hypothetical protein D6802_11520 [Ardenticatenia bacterium]|nr:MAG: hypothetical protein D6802_11520 [Ardenticatenia bacterium]
MLKLAVIVLADTETHADLGRVVNAMEVVRECLEKGDDVRLIFDGAGTRWVPALAAPQHKRHALFQQILPAVEGVCLFCAGAFGVRDAVQACGVRLLDEHDGHPSVRALLADGYQVLTF